MFEFFTSQQNHPTAHPSEKRIPLIELYTKVKVECRKNISITRNFSTKQCIFSSFFYLLPH